MRRSAVNKPLNDKKIVAGFVISVATVYTHASDIFSKLLLASRTQAALYALCEGFAPSSIKTRKTPLKITGDL